MRSSPGGLSESREILPFGERHEGWKAGAHEGLRKVGKTALQTFVAGVALSAVNVVMGNPIPVPFINALTIGFGGLFVYKNFLAPSK